MDKFTQHFGDFESQKEIFEPFCNPFTVDVETAPVQLQMEVIELQFNKSLTFVVTYAVTNEYLQKIIKIKITIWVWSAFETLSLCFLVDADVETEVLGSIEIQMYKSFNQNHYCRSYENEVMRI